MDSYDEDSDRYFVEKEGIERPRGFLRVGGDYAVLLLILPLIEATKTFIRCKDHLIQEIRKKPLWVIFYLLRFSLLLFPSLLKALLYHSLKRILKARSELYSTNDGNPSFDRLYVVKAGQTITAHDLVILALTLGVIVGISAVLLGLLPGLTPLAFVLAKVGLGVPVWAPWALVTLSFAVFTMLGSISVVALSAVVYGLTKTIEQLHRTFSAFNALQVAWKHAPLNNQEYGAVRFDALIKAFLSAARRIKELLSISVGVLIAVITLLIFSPMVNVLYGSEQIRERVNRFLGLKKLELSSNQISINDKEDGIDMDRLLNPSLPRSEKLFKHWYFLKAFLIRPVLIIALFTLFLPVMLCRGFIFGFANGWAAGSYGFRSGLGSIAEHSKHALEGEPSSRAEVEHLGAEEVRNLFYTPILLSIVATLIMVPLVLFFPPATHAMAYLMTILFHVSHAGMALEVVTSVGVSLGVVGLGALTAEAGMIIAWKLSFTLSPIPNKDVSADVGFNQSSSEKKDSDNNNDVEESDSDGEDEIIDENGNNEEFIRDFSHFDSSSHSHALQKAYWAVTSISAKVPNIVSSSYPNSSYPDPDENFPEAGL